MGSRKLSMEGVKKSAEQLAEKGLNVDSLKVNILDSESIQEVVSYVKEKYGKLDILVNLLYKERLFLLVVQITEIGRASCRERV